MSARGVLKIPRQPRRQLEREMKKTKDAALRVRIHAVLLYAAGHGSVTISRQVVCAPATVWRVVERYRSGGRRALSDRRRANGSPKVDADVEQAVAELVSGSPLEHGERRPTWTLELLQGVLAESMGVCLSTATIHRVLRRLGARWGMPKPIVACPWTKWQKESRLRRIRRILSGLKPDEVAYYEDEVDINLNPKIGRDWMHRGTQKEVLTPGQNQKGYLAGALEVNGTDIVVVEWPKKDADLFLRLLGELHRKHPDKRRIHLIVDNFSIHSAERVNAQLTELGDRFQLHFLPPYCPDENKIERIWRDLHANVTRNHRCQTLDKLLHEVHHWIGSESNRRRALENPVLRRSKKRVA